MKNIRKRNDGRWEYKKSINGKRYYLYAKTQKALLSKIKSFKPTSAKINTNVIALDYINNWYNMYKKNLASNERYSSAIHKYFNIPLFKKEIQKLTYIDLEEFLYKIDKPRTKAYCYYIIKGIFETAYKQKIVKEDLSKLITKPKNQSKKGNSFNLKEQKLILDNLDKSNMKYEILFYLLTGCRRNEVENIKLKDIDFVNKKIYIPGTKTESSKRYVPISEEFKQILKQNFNTMFKKFTIPHYSKVFAKYLKLLKISNHKLHDLRHTFSTNLYYLGVSDKERQYYLGHTSIIITNDIYTHLDPTITKNNILNLYKDLYPKF